MNVNQLFKYIKERKTTICDIMMGGGIKNIEHYQRLLGNLEVLSEIEEKLRQSLDEHE